MLSGLNPVDTDWSAFTVTLIDPKRLAIPITFLLIPPTIKIEQSQTGVFLSVGYGIE